MTVLQNLSPVAYRGISILVLTDLTPYAAEWRTKADAEPAVVDWKAMRKPAGTKKAAIVAMTAILKPGRSTQASLKDHNWVSEETRAIGCIQPCVAFLNALLTIGESVPGNPT